MSTGEYHGRLSRWFRVYIADLVADIPGEAVWERHEFINSPGWTLMHLISEGELAIAKLDPDYVSRIPDHAPFLSGSDGNAQGELDAATMLDIFGSVYARLEGLVAARTEELKGMEISDEILKGVLETELDFYLHILTTHIAMHCDALTKWRLYSGRRLPYS